MLAWLIKPAIGYLIDNFLNKRIWIFISLAFDMLLISLLGLLSLPIAILVALLLLNSTNAAFRDVAVDGIMCMEGKHYHATGKIQSVQWISINIAALVTGIGGGLIAEKWGYKAAFLCLAPAYIAICIAAIFYKEIDYYREKSTFIKDMKRLLNHKKLIIVGLFIFLYKYSPSFGTPLFFIQRDEFKWGKVWIGALGSIGTVFGIIGSVLYYKFSERIKLKKWIFYSVFLGALTSLSYLYYTPATAVIYDIVYNFIGMFIFLMIMDFMARSTIQGLEATSFAFLASVSNLALTASNLSGAYLLPRIGLKWLIIISALTSFLCLPLINKIEEA